MQEKHTTDRALKKWVQVLIKLMIVLFFGVGSYLFVTSLNLSAPVKKILVAYDIEQKPKYKVNIIENAYIDDESLTKNENYVTNIVENIDVNFSYIYEATKKGNYEYDYDVKATIYGEYQGGTDTKNENLWTKEYSLVDNVKEKVNDVNTFSIDKDLTLDFQEYNSQVVNFKNDLNVPIVGHVEVVMTVNVKGDASGNKIVDTKEQKIIIPLNQIAFSIKTDVKENDHKELTKTLDNRPINMYKFDIGIVMIVYSLTILGLTFKKIFKINKKTDYEIELEKLLKSYGDVIVELATSVNLDDKDVVLVKSFNELLDLEEELRIPINYMKISSEVGEFFIVNHDICYKWFLDVR